MKILIISNLYPSSENVDDHLGKLLLHRYAVEWSSDHEIKVINPHSYNILTARKLKKKQLKSSVEIDGLNILNVPILRLPGDRLQVRKFKKIVQDLGQFDFILGCLPVGIEISHFVGKLLNIPYFAYFHITDYHRSGISNHRISKKYSKFIQKAAGLIYVSPIIQKAFEKHTDIEGMLLTGAISSSWFDVFAERNFHSKLKLVSTARLIKRKNIDLLLIALSELSIDFSLLIVGDGPERNRLANMVSNNTNLIERVSFTGKINQDELKRLYDEHDFMILVSENESFGLVYLEAMSRGCIPIGTQGEGIDGVIIHRENGFLCNPDTESIKSQLVELKNISRENLVKTSLNARETAKNFVYDTLSDGFIEFARTKLGRV